MERFVGRTLAITLHPYAAWRTRSAKGRTLLVASYVAASYATVLIVLLLRAN